MCGFAGVVSFDERFRVTREQLARMSAAIAHRGPDGEGIWFNRDPDDPAPVTPDNPLVGLAFRRLAILDPDPRAMQPMTSPDGRYTMVFNGEIYNFRELRAELSGGRDGETERRSDEVGSTSSLVPRPSSLAWQTSGDSEVLLRAYATWGPACLHKLNGMFAIAIWDAVEKTLCLARDRMGQKPLYCSSSSGIHAFASEADAISALTGDPPTGDLWLPYFLSFACSGPLSPAVAHQVTPAGIEAYALGIGCSHTTFFDGARGHAIVGDPDPLNVPRAFQQKLRAGLDLETALKTSLESRASIRTEKQSSSQSTPVTAIRAALDLAVQRQLISDVPLGVFLSGGIDSSVVALCARKLGPVQTFSIAFDDPRYDESPYAREVAKHLGTQHHEFRVTPNVIEDLPKLIRVFGEPFADSSMIPTHMLARETRKHVKVALSGDGGDELFGGYDRYEAMRLGARWSNWVPKFVARSASSWSRGHPKSKLTRAARFVASLALPEADRYESYLRIFDDELIDELLLEPQTDQRLRRSVASVYEGLRKTRGPVEAALATDRVTYLPNDLLTKVDRCSMLHGLEVRSPFMDHELVQLAATLTEDQLLGGGKKRMLREAFAHELPASVFNRQKMGFAVPIGEWFRTSLRSHLRDHLFAQQSFAKQHFRMNVVERIVDEHESERRDHSQRLFALLVLEVWCKSFSPGLARGNDASA
jgi:asparagine synthase (glutamine-hydrolysing)